MCPCPASGAPRHGRVITPWPYQCTSGGERRETLTGCYDRIFPTPIHDQLAIFILVHLERPAKPERTYNYPGLLHDSCHGLRMREKRTYMVSGVILARNGRKDFPLGLCNHEQRGQTRPLLERISVRGSLSSRSPRELTVYILPVQHIHRRVLQ